ncbi:MAG: PBP1A family penicillin-binding protein, partial [Nitrospinota bacterium]|nr:PBP1A family penicillin-binding protein [Nitrospinota bacterium]
MSGIIKNPSPLYNPRPTGSLGAKLAEDPAADRWYKRPWFKKLMLGLLALVAAVSLAAGAVGYNFYLKLTENLPDIEALRFYKPSLVTRIFDTNDTLVAEYYVERRILLPLDSIPEVLRRATIAVEDSAFLEHHGINWEGIIRAAWENFKAGRVVQGGSSITQQVTKALLLSSERTYKRKFREAILATKIERSYTKNEILEIYLNHIYYGEGAYGVEAAAQTYFGKSVNQLTIPEVAMIVGLPKAPSDYSPHGNLAKAVERRGHVLRRMLDTGVISKTQMEDALTSTIKLAPRAKPLNKAPWFSEHVRRFLEKKFSADGLYREGLTVRATMDLQWEEWAEEAMKTGLEAAAKRLGYRGAVGFVDVKNGKWPEWTKVNPERGEFESAAEYYTPGRTLSGVALVVEKEKVIVGFEEAKGVITLENLKWAHPFDPDKDALWAGPLTSAKSAVKEGDIITTRILGAPLEGGLLPLELFQEPLVQGALMAMDPKTGHVKAMVGGYDAKVTKFNRAVQAYRQPGSAFKPIIYTAALTKGYTPASVIIDSPIIFNRAITEFKGWKPVNFEEKFYGPTTLRTAITHSRNIVTIKLLEKITPEYVMELARTFGFQGNMDPNLSLALGSATVSLEELVAAYGALANLGSRPEPVYIKSIENRDGDILYKSEPVLREVAPPAVAYQMVSMMESVIQEGTGQSLKGMLKGRPLAGKTGTTNDYIDAWFMGYTPDVVCGVWTGRDDNLPIGKRETGSRMAIPIWGAFMEKVFAQSPVNDFQPPP